MKNLRMKSYFCLAVTCLLFAACSSSDDELLCPDGEIAVDDVCCPDINDNGICDDAETADDCAEDESFIDGICCIDADEDGVCDDLNGGEDCDHGEVLIDGTCCVDANDNGICDDEESEEDCEEDESFIDGTCCVDADDDGVCDADDCDEDERFIDGACCVDADGDGFCEEDDCDDSDPQVYPGAPEICGYAVVNDCDNACYDAENCDDAAVFSEAKTGQIGEYDHAEDAWEDVTALYDDAASTYEAQDGQWTLAFCDLDASAGNNVDVLAKGADVNLTLRTGYTQHTDLLSESVYVHSTEDRPVALVQDGAHLTTSRLVLRHEEPDTVSSAHGVFCENAVLSLENSSLERNEASRGGGLYASGCEVGVEGTLRVASNVAEQGAGIFLEKGEIQFGRSEVRIQGNSSKFGAGLFLSDASADSALGVISFEGNISAGTETAALHVEGDSSVSWSSSTDIGGYSFAKNGGQMTSFLDVFVDASSSVHMDPARFLTPDPGHLSTETNAYNVTDPEVELECSQDACTY